MFQLVFPLPFNHAATTKTTSPQAAKRPAAASQ
jgi:hypothetical protein